MKLQKTCVERKHTENLRAGKWTYGDGYGQRIIVEKEKDRSVIYT